MKFDWDPAKNKANVEKHGLDFADAIEVFDGDVVTYQDLRQDYGETRWFGLGLLRFDIVVIIFTERNEDTIRIISMREALPHEQRLYESAFQD